MRRNRRSLARRMVLGGGLLFFGVWTLLPMYWIVATAPQTARGTSAHHVPASGDRRPFSIHTWAADSRLAYTK